MEHFYKIKMQLIYMQIKKILVQNIVWWIDISRNIIKQ